MRNGGTQASRAFLLCPKCDAPAFIRSSERITATVKHMNAHCTNTGCGHTFLMELSFVHSFNPGLIDRPDLNLKVCPREQIPMSCRPKSARRQPVEHVLGLTPGPRPPPTPCPFSNGHVLAGGDTYAQRTERHQPFTLPAPGRLSFDHALSLAAPWLTPAERRFLASVAGFAPRRAFAPGAYRAIEGALRGGRRPCHLHRRGVETLPANPDRRGHLPVERALCPHPRRTRPRAARRAPDRGQRRVNLEAEILKGLQARFQFRKTKGAWLQEGICPACGKREAFCAAKDPKIVRCGRQDRCGWEESVRDLLPDLFEDWSKRFPETETNPTATADAYLLHERCLDLRLLRGAYTQELYRDHKTGHTSATVRFQIGDTHWERLIDRPGRFEKKAHFRKGGTYKGHCWIPPRLTMEDIAKADEILIAEGIFDAVALCQVRKVAVSAMSTNNWPEHFLAALRAELERIGRTVRPRLVFAFDVGRAGVEATTKYVKRAITEGWDASAMQVRPDGEGTKKDWNDLLKDHLDWAGDPDKAPLSDWAFDQYRYNGAITIAETARDKARLMADHKMAVSSFEFRHKNRLWSCKVSFDEESEKRRIVVEEIANCAFRLLYREFDEVASEATYFLQIDFPTIGSQTRAASRQRPAPTAASSRSG
jgi:hypothetical protein